MKKLLAVLLIGCMLLGLCACDADSFLGSDEVGEEQVTPEETRLLIQEDVYDQDGNLQYCIRYDYDSFGRKQGQTSWEYNGDFNVWDFRDSVSYCYNQAGLLVQKISYNKTAHGVTDYIYDASGNLLRETYGANGELDNDYTYTYNENGQIDTYTVSIYTGGDWSVYETETYFYDEDNTLLYTKSSFADDFGRKFTYDEKGNLIKEESNYGENSTVTTYTYNKKDQLISQVFTVYGHEREDTYTYDEYGDMATSTLFGEKHVYHYASFDSTEAPTPWKSAYRNYISGLDNVTEETEFYLVDLNHDETPELFINFVFYSEGMKLCTFDGSAVKENHLRGWASVSYVPEQGLLYHASGHHGMFADLIFRIDGSELVTVAGGTWTEPVDAGGFVWDEKSVTKDEYENYLSKAFPEESSIPIGMVRENEEGEFIFGPCRYSQQQIQSLLSEPQ